MKKALQGQLPIAKEIETKKEKVLSHFSYRDPIHIRKDVISTLLRFGELNQSKLVSYCNLNNTKHMQLIRDLVKKGLIIKTVEKWGSKDLIKYRVSEKGNKVMREIMQPYEDMFPRFDNIYLDNPRPNSSRRQGMN
jgi:predicted transcriptional regulator